MIPKKKADELVNKYKPYVYPYLGSSYMTGDEYPEQILNYGKICALIAVDEILHSLSYKMSSNIEELDYYNEVRQEIENLKTK